MCAALRGVLGDMLLTLWQAPKSSVRAKTSALWGKMMGQGTARERSVSCAHLSVHLWLMLIDICVYQKTDASMHPASQTLMNAFAPPVPAIPPEHRSPLHSSPIADVFGTTTVTAKRALPVRKPLPDIMTPDSKHSDDTDRSIVFVEKQRSPLPPLPNESPMPVTPKRRSNSVSHDARMPPLLPLSLTGSSTAATPATPDNSRARKGSDTTFGGLLDVFKGELSVLDLDLRDPSTPPRPVLQTDLSPRNDRAENNPSSPSPSAPTPTEQEPAGLAVIVPPRSSSLSLKAPTPRHPLAGHVADARQQPSGQPRSNSGPTSLAAQTFRDGARLRLQHRSTASNSEPSLVAAAEQATSRDNALDFDTLLARGVKSSVVLRRGSEHDIAFMSPDSARLTASSSPTPIITGDEHPEDLETRGKELATRCWNDNEDFLPKEKIAEWLGGQ